MLVRQSGDTIIEVLLAFAVFSMVSVGAMTVMGQGTNASQRALEITLVRQQIDAQAEALRAAQQAFTTAVSGTDTEWQKIALQGNANDSQHYSDTTKCPTAVTQINNSFIMNPSTASKATGTWFQDSGAVTSPPFAQVTVNGATVTSYGMWIERTYHQSATNSPSSYDFDVRACWYGAGMNVPLQIETSVRLYEPAI